MNKCGVNRTQDHSRVPKLGGRDREMFVEWLPINNGSPLPPPPTAHTIMPLHSISLSFVVTEFQTWL